MITCLFSCDGCGLVDSPVRVRDRAENEDVVYWMEKVCMEAVGMQHSLLSPMCRAKKLKYLKIPIDKEEGSWIGKQTDSVPPKGNPDADRN